jgi:RNA polymerase sigma-70 factor, ECF subfamily
MVLQKTDEEIILALQKGDRTVLQYLFDTCYGNLCQYAHTIIKDPTEAEDVVQVMFIKLWEKREVLQINQSVKAYLFKSVYHQCINLLEHRTVVTKHQSLRKMEIREEILPSVFPEELEASVQSAIDKLPPQCRTIFMMSRYEELKHSEIAATLNLSVNTVENQISKALKLLRESLKDVIS